MPDKNKHSSFTKYIVAAVAAVLVLGVTVTAVMIKSHRKANIVIQKSSSDVSEQSDTSFSDAGSEKKKAENEASENEKSENEASDKRKMSEKKAEPTEDDSDSKSSHKQHTTKESHERRTASVTTAVDFPIDINLATEEQLCAINGVGPSTAKSIIDYRKSLGKYGYLEQLMDIEGIGEKTFQKLKQYLYVSEKDRVTTTQSVTTTSAVRTEISKTETSSTSAEKSKTAATERSTTKAVTDTATAQRQTDAPKTTMVHSSSASAQSSENSIRTSETTLPSSKTSSQSSETSVTKPERLNINEAETEDFALFFDISEEKAQKITDIREKIHGFINPLQILLAGVVSENQLKAVIDRLDV